MFFVNQFTLYSFNYLYSFNFFFFNSTNLSFFYNNNFESYFNSLFLVNFVYFFNFILVCILIVFLLVFVSYFLSNSFFLNDFYLKNKSYECGFDPSTVNLNYKFNLHFYKVALIFLLFDLELLYIFPWVSVAKFFFNYKIIFFWYSFFPFLFFLLLGVLYEYLSDIITWNKFKIFN